MQGVSARQAHRREFEREKLSPCGALWIPMKRVPCESHFSQLGRAIIEIQYFDRQGERAQDFGGGAY
jgi:hypothetical protein